MKVYVCECGQRVIRARTEHLKWQLLNPGPDPAGNVHARKDHNGNWTVRSVKPGTPAVFPEVLMMPHAATCTGAPQAAAGAEFRQQWRDASAALHRGQRNKRGHRPAPEVTGVSVPPPALPGL